MKKVLLLFITTSFVLSQNLIEDVSERYENGNIKTIKYYQRVSNKDDTNYAIVQVREENYYILGLIKSEGYYQDGEYYLLNVWRIDGGLMVKDGNGKWTSYYENGQIHIEENYKDGKKDGKWTSYYENGQIKYEQNYKDGKKETTWYSVNGEIIYSSSSAPLPISPEEKLALKKAQSNVSSCTEYEDVCLHLRNHDASNKSFEIYMINSVPIAGLQFDLSDIEIIDGKGGLLEDNGYQSSNSSSRFLSFSMQGKLIESTSGLLTTIYYAGTPTQICMDNIIVAGVGGNKISNNTPECIGIEP